MKWAPLCPLQSKITLNRAFDESVYYFYKTSPLATSWERRACGNDPLQKCADLSLSNLTFSSFFFFEQIKWRQNVLLLTYPWNTYIRSFLHRARAFTLRTPRHTGGMCRRARTRKRARSLTHASSDEATAEPWNIFIHLCSHGNKWNHIPFTTLFSTQKKKEM